MDSENFKVIVTGFGPFKGHNVNASWETAKALNESNLNEHNINLIVKEIPVIYDTVINQIPSLWKEHQPDVCIKNLALITNYLLKFKIFFTANGSSGRF